MQRKSLLGLATLVVGLIVSFASRDVNAQVFTVDPNGTTGEIDVGEGEALYGQFGLSTTPNSYGVYRKFQPGNSFPAPLEIHTIENVTDNPSQMEWAGLHQGGPSNGDTGFLAPGVFIGNSPSTSSYEDNLVYFGKIIDGESSTGDISEDTDSEGRRDWDLRFAFLEQPQDFVDARRTQFRRLRPLGWELGNRRRHAALWYWG